MIVGKIAEVLIQRYPQRATLYQQNTEVTTARLDALDKKIMQTLTPVAKKSYIVFHDAYQYIEQRYQLRPPLVIMLSPHIPASAKHLLALRQQIQEQGARCIFSEPQFPDKIVNTIATKEMHRGVLDPLGSRLPAGAELYFTMMQQLVDNIAQCLTTA